MSIGHLDPFSQGLIGDETSCVTRTIAVGNNYLWKTDGQLNRVAQVRYAHGDELSGLPGVTGVGIGKDHIIVYVSSEAVVVPAQIEEVPIIKIRR